MSNPILDDFGVSPQSVYEVSPVKNHRVGTRGRLDDRTFFYGLHVSATAISPNVVATGTAPVAAHTTETGAVTAVAPSVSAGTAPAPAGSQFITLALGATVAGEDEYTEGYLKVESSTLGPGQIYKLKNFPFTLLSGTTDTIKLYDPIVTTCTGTVTWSLVHNPYAYVVTAPGAIAAKTVGVPLCTFPAATTATVATAGYLHTAGTAANTGTWSRPNYGWFQTWGPTSVQLDSTALVAGSEVSTSTTASTAGVDDAAAAIDRIGIAMEALTGPSKFASVFLHIQP